MRYSLLMRYALVIIVLLSAIERVEALSQAETEEYRGGVLGKVVFSMKTHADQGIDECADCHPSPFAEERRPTAMDAREHMLELACAACHNGKRAFSAHSIHTCDRCHQRK